MPSTPFSCTLTAFGTNRLVLSGDISATIDIIAGGTLAIFSGDIVGQAVIDGTPDIHLTGTISGLFSGAITATIHTFGMGNATIEGTIGSDTLSAAVATFGYNQASVVGGVESSGPPAITLPIIDTVNRADNPASMGNTESPVVTWEQVLDGGSEGIGIKNHQFYIPGATGTTNSYGYVETGHADNISVKARVITTPSGYIVGVVARLTDASTHLKLRTYDNGDGTWQVDLQERIEGVQNQLDTAVISQAVTSLELVVNGANVTGYANGEAVTSGTTALLTGTKHGIYFNVDDEAYRIYNFRIDSTLAAFTPAGSLHGLLAWLEADAIAGHSDGDTLSTWLDSSGNGNNAAVDSGVGDVAPVYHTNVINSLPGVFFADTPYTALSMDGLSPSNPFTIFVIYNYTGAASGAHRAVHGQGTNWLIGPYNGSYQVFGGGGFAANPPAVVQNQFVLQTAVQVAGNVDNYVGTTLYGSVVPNTTPNNVQIGAYGGETLGGYIVELVVCSGDQSALISQMASYANSKYGI